MAILDQLMEKKDLVIYIDERTKQLNNIDLSRICPKHRENARIKREGKVCELKKIKHLISQGTLKKTAINLWEQNRNKQTRDKLNDAVSLVKDAEECKKCHTGKDYVVAGYIGTYCKCEAEKLVKTKPAMQAQKACHEFLNLDIKPTDKGVIGTFCGIDIVVTDPLSFDLDPKERKKCAKKILKDLNKVRPDFSSLADHPEDKKSLLTEEDKRIIREGTFMEATVELLGKSVNQDWLKEASDYLKTLRYAGKRMNS